MARRPGRDDRGSTRPEAPRIDGHVKVQVPAQFTALMAACRDKGRWPDDALVWYLVIRLVAGMEDDREWSDDVLLALEAERAERDRVTRAVRRHPDVKEQMGAGQEVLRSRLWQLMKRRQHGEPRLGDQAREDYARETRELQAQAMRAAAERQRQRRIWERWGLEDERGKRGRGRQQKSHLKLRSLIDGWRWHDGRPRTRAVPLLLLRVEVWRDVLARVRPADGRVTRAEALAEVLVSDLKTSHPATYKLVDGLRRQYVEEKGYTPTRALTCAMASPPPLSSGRGRAACAAVTERLGKQFRTLQSQLSQALKRYRSATALLERVRDRRAGPAASVR